MRRLLSFLLLLSLCADANWVMSAEENQPIRVMSFNIRYNNPGDGINAWPHRKNHVAEMIGKRYQADLAGLQEALKGQIDDLVKQLPDYEWFGVGREDGKEAGEYTPIFYRKDRFDLLQQDTFWLSETPDVAGSKSWDSSLMRIVTWGKFKDKKNGKLFYYFNTHFDHRGRQARVESAKLVWKKIAAITGKTPAVLTGDFNVRENSMPYAILTGKETAGDSLSDLKDARYLSIKAHEGPTSTVSSGAGWTKYGPPGSKIDFIFVRNGFLVASHRVLDDRFDNRFPSDHLPVLAEIGLLKK